LNKGLNYCNATEKILLIMSFDDLQFSPLFVKYRSG